MSTTSDLSIAALKASYDAGTRTPEQVLEAIDELALATAHYNVWIYQLSSAEREPYLARLRKFKPNELPLWGIPFAIKDNIDLAGCPTTAACPAFGYVPEKSATSVQRLLDAGAIPIGKTNLDQFATGLVGTRTPYGCVANAIEPKMISGGSSAGSAVAVKLGLCSFALGTDTAGSGRVPAALNDLLGFKPSCGSWSTVGVVPACRTLDCVSVFTSSAHDALTVDEVVAGYDDLDPYSKRLAGSSFDPQQPRFAVLGSKALEACDAAHLSAYQAAVAEFPRKQVLHDFSVFADAASLLYEGPWIAERFVATASFLETNADNVLPTTLSIIRAGATGTAAEAFAGQYRLAELKREVQSFFRGIDVLVLPTVPTTYTQSAVIADPIATNSRLGTYTNFVNLLDLCAVAVPAGRLSSQLPFGITLVAQSGQDKVLLALAQRILREPVSTVLKPAVDEMPLLVCGAHLSGQPLNHQLTQRGGHLLRQTTTSPNYRLYQLADGKRPAIVRDVDRGVPIEVEVWALPSASVGTLLEGIGAPLGLGQVELVDGQWVTGFIAEARASEDALEISEHGGWRAFLAATA